MRRDPDVRPLRPAAPARRVLLLRCLGVFALRVLRAPVLRAAAERVLVRLRDAAVFRVLPLRVPVLRAPLALRPAAPDLRRALLLRLRVPPARADPPLLRAPRFASAACDGGSLVVRPEISPRL